MSYACEKCGSCCRHLDRSELYKELDRGDGICKYLSNNLCTIYDKRPLLCRIDESYDAFFSEIYTKDEYYGLNKEACNYLQTL
ncbi:MAG: YkgJ family cysteine cluster protein [Butyrivibrio sp.]|nr:YkgJ family cysteine cluster protein [Butyrivibrio sp.]